MDNLLSNRTVVRSGHKGDVDELVDLSFEYPVPSKNHRKFRAVARLIESGVLQAKLRIGQLKDIYEQEENMWQNLDRYIPDKASLELEIAT